MAVVCAWCNRLLRGRRTDQEVSQGMCGPCAAAQLLSAGLVPCFAPEQGDWQDEWKDLGGEGGGA